MAGYAGSAKRIRPVMWEPSIFAGLMNMQGTTFKLSQSDEKPYICGERCWQLRCEYLHQNKGFLNDENNIRFHLGLNCGMSVCQLESMNIQENGNDIQYRHRTVLSEGCARQQRVIMIKFIWKKTLVSIIHQFWILFR